VSIRTSIILVVSLAMVAGYVFFVQLNQTAEVPDEPPWFYSVDMSDLTRIAIIDQGEEAVFFLGEDERWHLDELDGLPVGRDRWGGVVLLLTGPKSRRLLDEQPTDLGPYGLDSPTTRVEVNLRGGQAINVLLGLPTPDGESTYAQVEGFVQVFTVFSGWAETLTRLVAEPPYPEWYYNIEPTEITRIELLTREVAVNLTKDNAGWRSNDAEQSAVDETQIPSMLASLERPPQTVVAYDAIDQEQYGLNQPLFSLFLQTERPNEDGIAVISESRFTIGNPTEDGTGYYVKTQRGEFSIPDVFRVDADWVEGIQAIAANPPYLDEVDQGN
jgi:hypothetical protein